jgi:uncharacterized damage-inducible protein DinB
VNQSGSTQPEFWLRGPVAGVCAQLQPAAHSLLQSLHEMETALAGLSANTVSRRPGAAASVSFHARHAAGTIDRLLTYARGESLNAAQMAAIQREKETDERDGAALLEEVRKAIEAALAAIRATAESTLDEPRAVGRARLPSTCRGLLFHTAEHTLMHSAQIRTTMLALRDQ